MSPKTTSVLRLKKNSSHIYEGKDECSVEGAFPSENPRFGFLNHMIHSSFFVSDWQVIFVYPREM